ncbi:hypothetical protein CTI12_AA458480 [Artemisia annua]|uniref:Helitron helicase-like domain-containing protein n=1 Tax=Artemisia annua TaxID=35608 RepID=A0A2U1LSP3_ARTAN|nr:hypothetical protein CTI12_AA458480 [Artemisia annua]
MSRRLVASDFIDPRNNDMLSSTGSNGFKEHAVKYHEGTIGINNMKTPAHSHVNNTRNHTWSTDDVAHVNYRKWSTDTANLQQQRSPSFMVPQNHMVMPYSESAITCAPSMLKSNVREFQFPAISNDRHKKLKGVQINTDSDSKVKGDTVLHLNDHNGNPFGPTFLHQEEGMLHNKGKNVVLQPPSIRDVAAYCSSPTYVQQCQPFTSSSICDNYTETCMPTTENSTSAQQNFITSRQSKSRYRRSQQPHVNCAEQTIHGTSSRTSNKDVSQLYIDIGDCDYMCQHCNAYFWYGERSGTSSRSQPIKYTKCCGGRQYQLPTSGTLGAIVIEPDTNTQTDYDVIIEYKDKRPQRINKLHSSYMSLQFPLLFVYGQPGYNTKMTLEEVTRNRKRNKLSMNMYYKYQLHERYNQMAESSMTVIQPSDKKKMVEIKANIKDLRPRDRNRVLEAKVYRAWIARDPPDTNEKGCRAILLDREVC